MRDYGWAQGGVYQAPKDARDEDDRRSLTKSVERSREGRRLYYLAEQRAKIWGQWQRVPREKSGSAGGRDSRVHQGLALTMAYNLGVVGLAGKHLFDHWSKEFHRQILIIGVK